MAKRKLIIDCDAGTDDAVAIMMALAHPDVDVIAITAVFGNNCLEKTSKNILRTLKICDRLDIPVYKGCELSMIGTQTPSDGYHGDDALGDVILPDVDPVDTSLFQTEHGVNALNRLVNDHPGEITVIAIGPLTNLAMALHLDPQFGEKLASCMIMGGNVKGKGNITISAEFNFWADPEAAFFVLGNMKRKMLLASVDVCEENSFSWEWYTRFEQISTKKARFVQAIEKKMNDRVKALGQVSEYVAWDQLAMAAVLEPSVIVESQDVFVTVELQGSKTRGQMVVDWKLRLGHPANISLITKVNNQLYEQLYFKAVDHHAG